jgi:hypothetical protein
MFRGTYLCPRCEAYGPATYSMGNSTSHGLHRRTEEQQSWANSYPRDPRTARSVKAPQNKVLPERIPGQRLRVTDNGAILQNGGTISGRRQTISLGENVSRHDQVCDDFASFWSRVFSLMSLENKLLSTLNLFLHRAHLFLRTCQLWSHSRTSQHFMEPEGSFPCSQELSNGRYPEPHKISP